MSKCKKCGGVGFVEVPKDRPWIGAMFCDECSGVGFLRKTEVGMNLQERTVRLAKAMGMKPTRKTHAIVSDGKWWIVGCEDDDRVLPRSGRYMSLREALDMAEAWLAPELCELEKKEKDNGSDDQGSD